MSFEEQIERWDRTATASPGSFAAALKAYWLKQKILKNEDFDAYTTSMPKEWPTACDHGVLMVNECGQCNTADANNRICKSGDDGIKEQLATKQNPFYKDEK